MAHPLEPVVDDNVGELLPNLEAIVIDSSGKPLERNQVGEMRIRNDFRTRRYLNEPAQTEEILGEDGWIRTGDICRVNERGEWYIMGRVKVILVLFPVL
jgi:long-subunit acyl-CoA synthetase (AMP-forming)